MISTVTVCLLLHPSQRSVYGQYTCYYIPYCYIVYGVPYQIPAFIIPHLCHVEYALSVVQKWRNVHIIIRRMHWNHINTVTSYTNTVHTWWNIVIAHKRLHGVYCVYWNIYGYTKISEFNLSAFTYKLFHEDISSIVRANTLSTLPRVITELSWIKQKNMCMYK